MVTLNYLAKSGSGAFRIKEWMLLDRKVANSPTNRLIYQSNFAFIVE